MSQAQVECKKKKKKKKPQVKVKSKLLLQLSLRLSAECRMVGQHDDICLESKVEPEQDWVATDNLGKTNSRAGSNTNRTKKKHKGREHILHAYTPDMRVHNKYYLVSTTWSDWVTFSNPNIIQHLISAITLDLWVWIGIASGNLVVAHIKVRERERWKRALICRSKWKTESDRGKDWSFRGMLLCDQTATGWRRRSGGKRNWLV